MLKKVAIVYPPLPGRGFPHLGQNRWFRYSCSASAKIHPIVPSMAATLLRNKGYEVMYLDGINKGLSFSRFMEEFCGFEPDVAILETKAPSVRAHWKFIDTVKSRKGTRFILTGDHVSFFPEESFKNSSADYCVTGGDYDAAVLGLLEHLNGRAAIPKGVWYRDNGRISNTGRFELIEELDTLPFIDRDLTDWSIYGEAYLYRPCAYIISGRGCGTRSGSGGSCGFCSWQHAFWGRTARLRSPGNVAEELSILARRYKVKEVFDDNESGAIYDKAWLKEFHRELRARRLSGRLYISSNARADVLDTDTCRLLKKTGFRLLKVGLESASDRTLSRLNKQETVSQIEEGVMNAKDHGLRVMLTVMIGYPWEDEDAVRMTYETVKRILSYKTRLGDALQVSLVIPYPGTPLYTECLKNRWLKAGRDDYDSYDMSRPVLDSGVDTALWGRRIWRLYLGPGYLFKSLITLRSYRDLLLVGRGMRSLLGHVSEWRPLRRDPR